MLRICQKVGLTRKHLVLGAIGGTCIAGVIAKPRVTSQSIDQMEERERLRRDLADMPQRELEKCRKQYRVQLEEDCARKASNQSHDASLTDEEKSLIHQIRNGKILAKVIVGPHFSSNVPSWKDIPICKMLQNYHLRHDLRMPYNLEKSEIYYKYHHMSGEIVRCRSLTEKEQRKNNKEFTHTKKCSTTYIADTLTTPLFRPGVALACDLDQSVIKALFNRDCATYYRLWASRYKVWVACYKMILSDLAMPFKSYTNFNAFVDDVKYQDARHNEVLAKLSRQSIAGLIIYNGSGNSSNTPFFGCDSHLPNAHQGHNEMKKILNRSLPISFYDNQFKVCRIYTNDESQLRKLKAKLQKNRHDKKGVSVKIDGFIEGVISHDTVPSILKLIDSLEKTLNNPETRDLFKYDNEKRTLIYNHPLAKVYIDRTKFLIKERCAFVQGSKPLMVANKR